MWQSSVFAIAGFCGILLLLKFAFPYLAPFLIGLVLALALDGPLSWLERRGYSRALLSPILVSAAFIGFPFLMVILLIQLWQEVQGLLASGVFMHWAGAFFHRILDSLPNWDLFFPQQLAPVNLSALVQVLLKCAAAIPDLVLIWVLAALSAYFFCRDKRALAKAAAAKLPERWQAGFFRLYRDTSRAMWKMFRVQLLLMGISSALSTAAFYLLYLPYPLLLGFLAGFFDLMPVLGPGLVYFVLALIQIWAGNFPCAVALTLTYLILLLVRQFVEPQLIGGRLGLHPLTALVGLYAGLRFWGLLGAVVGPAVMVFIKAAVVNYTSNSQL